MGISIEAKREYDKKRADRKREERAKKLEEAKEHQSGLIAECEAVGIDFEKVNHFWYKGKNYSIHVVGDKQKGVQELKDEIIAEMQEYSPVYPKIKYNKQKDNHLLVIDPADVHIGKIASSFETGEDYNSQIAVKRVHEGVEGLINKASGWNFDEVLLIIGNDILHVDGPRNQTTAGTGQDVCDMWYNNFMTGKQLYVDTIERLMQIAKVRVQYDPSNHDYASGFFLAETIKTWFRNCNNVEFNVSPAHRKYHVYHSNLIGTTHGDGAKQKDLPLLMTHEASEFWHKCKHRYFYTHDKHHKISEDIMSVCVETLRSPSGTDSWHHRNGYQFAPKAIEGYIHHPQHGQIARLTHLF